MNVGWIIEELETVIGCLRAYERLTKLPTCNGCNKIKTCKYRPNWGEDVRINCPLWEKTEEEE